MLKQERIYHIAIFEEVDNELNQIINIEASSQRDLLGLTHNSVGVNNITAQLAASALSSKEPIFFRKDYKSIELMPNDLILGYDKVDLNILKNKYLSDARYYMSHQQAIVTGIMMYDFICINNELIDKGFIITEDTREEIYIEILETEDEELIERLEQYLNAKDNIEKASFLEKEYQKFYREIKQAELEEDVIKIGDDFLKRLSNVSN